MVPAALEALRDDVLSVYQRVDRAAASSTPLGDDCQCTVGADTASTYTTWEPAPDDGPTFDDGREVTPDHDLFSPDEMADLFERSYELLGDPDAPVGRRSYTWRPLKGRPLPERTPEHCCQDADELELFLERMRTSLRTWGERFSLTDEWLLSLAWRQLTAWHRHWYLAYPHCRWPRTRDDRASTPETTARPAPKARAGRDRVGAHHATLVGPVYLEWLVLPEVTWFRPTSAEERRLSFVDEGWESTTEAKAVARKRILAAFVRALDEYLEDQEERLLWSTDKWRQTPGYAAREQYMEWLVRYQCLDESFTEIARSFSANPNHQTVAIPVGKLAKLMGLTLRPAKRGRRPDVVERKRRHRVR